LLVVCRDVLGNARDAAKLDYVPIAAPDVPITFILLAHLEDQALGIIPWWKRDSGIISFPRPGTSCSTRSVSGPALAAWHV
jgi:hypothetical protein